MPAVRAVQPLMRMSWWTVSLTRPASAVSTVVLDMWYPHPVRDVRAAPAVLARTIAVAAKCSSTRGGKSAGPWPWVRDDIETETETETET